MLSTSRALILTTGALQRIILNSTAIKRFRGLAEVPTGFILRSSSKLDPSCYSNTLYRPQSIREMHQTKIGQFFKKKPATSEETEDGSPTKKESTPEVVPKPTKKLEAKKNGKSSGSLKKERVSEPKESPPERKRKSRSMEDSESEEEEVMTKTKSKSKVKTENGNSNKKARRRIVEPESSSDEDVTKEKDDIPPSSPSSSAGSSSPKEPSPIPEKVKQASPVPQKPKVSTPKASKEKPKPKAKATPSKRASSSQKATPGKNETPAASKRNKTTEESPKKREGEGESPASPPKKPAAPVVSGWDNEYNPGKAKYHPIDDASWERGKKVPYLALSKTLEAIEATSSRLKNIEILANYFRSVIVLSPEDLVHSVYLCLNKLAPAYEGVELGIAETNIMKAIAQATGRALDRIKMDAASQGDLGLVAESSRSTQKTLFPSPPLTVIGVFLKLKEIAALTGNASQAKKISMITSMLVACKHSEARYLTRSLAGKLRIGLAEQSLLQALAQACFLTPPDQDMSVWPPKVLNAGHKLSAETLKARIEEEAFKLKSCFCECPNYELLVKAVIKDGTNNLAEHCKLSPGVPPRPMLAQPTKGVADVLQRFEGIKFTCEYKYDGERAQIHLLEDGSVRIYSRNQEDNTSKYPDIVNRFQSCIKGQVKSCILDSEAVAWDSENETILPFQVLSTRKRKDANESEIKVQVQLFAFDLIYLNGEALVKEPFLKRRQLLHENFQEIKGQFVFATSLDTDSMEEVQEFLEESIKGNCEGLMVKTLDVNASYELAKRSQKWLKLKKDYLDSGGDSLDLVVIGGFFGKGKRTGNYGGYLLACYNPEEEVYQTICKIGTGFSDEQLAQHAETLKPHIIPSAKSYYTYHQQLTPDHWFDPVQVWEVKCADLSLSPVHMAAAGIVDPLRGISLRFPRFLRVREDKNAEDATSSSQVADMYKNQEQVKNSTQAPKDNEDDFY